MREYAYVCFIAFRICLCVCVCERQRGGHPIYQDERASSVPSIEPIPYARDREKAYMCLLSALIFSLKITVTKQQRIAFELFSLFYVLDFTGCR